MLSQRVRADLALVLCTFIWGATFVVVKDALADISVLAFLAVRFALAAILMAVLFRGSITRLDKRGVWAGAQIGLFMFGGFVFQTTGLRWTTPSKAAFITGSSVVLVPLLLAAFGWRRITLQTWGQKHTSASHAAILFTLEPVFAALTSLLLGRERLDARTLAGAALVLVGILLAELKGPAPVPLAE